MDDKSHSETTDHRAILEQAQAAVHSHRIKLRVLTTKAFVFGFIAVAASIFIVWFYLIMYLPKQRQILHNLEKAAQEAKSVTSSLEDSVKQINIYLGVEVLLTHVVSMGVSVVAVSVGVLGSGMVVLVAMGT